MKILICSSEVAPFSKTGGLADVVGSLAPELALMGHDVRVVTPLHGTLNRAKLNLRPAVENLGVPLGFGEQWCAVHQTAIPGSSVVVYFIEHDHFFNRPALYQWDGRDYDDNAERFAFLARACCQLCKALDFAPDIANAHDWQTALLPVFLKTIDARHPLLASTASVLTIHNLGYQGLFPKNQIVHCQLGWEQFRPGCLEFHDQVNYLKAGILYADKVATVSPTYAREIQTSEGGWALDGVLRARSPDLVGILNGLDYQEWDPTTDRFIPATFYGYDLTGKAECKRMLQRRFQLAEDPNSPLFGMVTRLAYQKGIDVLATALPRIMDMDLQLVVLGTGEVWAHFVYGDLPNQYPGKAGAHIGFSNELAHGIIAGSDFLLMPSRYEPCGLSQLAAMRYGTLPVVRSTGGLEDTVANFDESNNSGDGFKFHDLTADAIANTVGWATHTYYNRKQQIHGMIERAMAKRYLWSTAARHYERLFQWALERKRGVSY